MVKITFALFAIVVGSSAYAGTISGTVKDPDGAPFKGAFVEAQNTQNKITMAVLSDAQGHYRAANLAAGDYTVTIKSVGYKADARSGINLGANQNASADFALQKTPIRWTELSNYEGSQILPHTEESRAYFGYCFECHGFQSRQAPAGRDVDGWADRIHFMRTAFARDLEAFTDKDADNTAAYLATLWGPNATLPKSPTDLPAYESVKHGPFDDAAMKLVYVSYALPSAGRFPGSAKIEKDGNAWIWEFDHSQLAKLDPKTGAVTDYKIPGIDFAGDHSTYMAPDGMVWFTQAENNTLGKLDPETGEINQYVPPEKGGKHTVVVDSKGIVWTSGSPLSSFDPKTGQFTYYKDVPNLYGITLDQHDNVWVAVFSRNGYIAKLDAQTHKITKYTPPSPNTFARRIKVDANGTVWFCEYQTGTISASDIPSETTPRNPLTGAKYKGKIASFDPKTEKFREYDLPGPSPTPYALTIDKRGHVWFSSKDEDIIGQLDPATGKVIEYPFLYHENGIRDFSTDSEGRIWWGSQPNEKVGYFYLATDKPDDKPVAQK